MIVKLLCSCDLLEKSYLCGVNNNIYAYGYVDFLVVICLKNRTFVVSTTTLFQTVTLTLQL